VIVSPRQYEQEYQRLEEALANGELSQSDYNAAVRELVREENDERREAAEEAAREAYEREMERW
jgi:molybdopterin biosynthesis enzyme MoaB